MSILDGPTEPPEHMPTKLKVVLGFYALSMLLDVIMLTQNGGETRTWIRIGIGALVIGLLMRGSEGMRTLVRGFAVLGALAGVVVLLQTVSIGVSGLLGMLVLAIGLFTTIASVFTFWALGQEDVQVWMATRTFGRVK